MTRFPILVLLAFTIAMTMPSGAKACVPLTINSLSSSFMASIPCLDRRFARDPNFAGGHILSGFDLAFTNGDHKPQMFGVAHRSGAIINLFTERGLGLALDDTPVFDTTAVVLADPDAGDPLTATLLYEPTNQTLPLVEVVGRNCHGTCRIGMPPDREARDGHFVIRGFLFLRDREFDDNLLEVAILPQCPPSEPCFIEATFKDNDERETFDVLIQYSVLPREALIGPSPHEFRSATTDNAVRASRNVATRFRQTRPNGATAGIQSFSLRYPNRDHFVGRIAIMPDQVRGATIVLRDGSSDETLTHVGYNVTFIGIDQNWLRSH